MGHERQWMGPFLQSTKKSQFQWLNKMEEDKISANKRELDAQRQHVVIGTLALLFTFML